MKILEHGILVIDGNNILMKGWTIQLEKPHHSKEVVMEVIRQVAKNPHTQWKIIGNMFLSVGNVKP